MPSTRWIIEMRLPESSTPSVLNSTVVLGVRRSALPSSNSISARPRSREIEFEDGSALRLTPNTTVEFSTLGVDDTGKRISMIHLVEGMAYVNWLGKDEFSMNFSRETIALDRAAHFRVESSPKSAQLAVFRGEANVEGPGGKV